MSPLARLRAFIAARNEYRRELRRTRQLHLDPVALFIAERTRRCPGSVIPAPLIYREYARWSEANGTFVRTPIRLALALAQSGYRKRVGNGVHWVDIDLLVEEPR